MDGGENWECPLARIHREWREECIRRGTYKGIDPGCVERERARIKAIIDRPPEKRRRRKNPKGHAD